MDHTQYTTNGAERKPGTHLTMEDRGAIQAMKKLGHSNRAIARYLHCAPSTISNELKRGTPPRTGSRGRAPGYSAKRGDAVYKENRKNSHKPHRIDKCTSFVQWVVTQVRTEKWSIDACVGYARKNKRSYGLNRIMAHLQETSFCVIGIALLCMNLTKRLRSLLHHFLQICLLGILRLVFEFHELAE